ncbi:conserved Plasmodium protein, unknown function [Plasmodium knowlesi strain H]|uniref:Uncharacterized protein n=3 Tax=Plasmodium knowlesi TaxID=5850 RepID=A0A5K1UKQ1_PLAKH|nr:conserved Plasmodium protein, unknown function [Plasmodium knowlesi strain H]OTN66284.1 Uncharacterized protein PKNOH_S09547900 [Plasmodium knowlesi]CAA9989835.1 conserved Plasmodium protein, unknown function [Plasmodium knowlesi strain H]SBO24384.1 conserved Plasmodium protein, unknown function [Plasmodium knowlesi strain H]SBO26634.1 conserved Plasmodium protein, unknown function [Plasmodium knowlesi strain H]VVS79309.1 conserved Plasmodium protein, unknown function [Plasmodium knowlesi s|eukprot:XP_002259850.1 hypothetical protein, conserved in Plasmodium species [Plasmodium knowlesi strain H]
MILKFLLLLFLHRFAGKCFSLKRSFLSSPRNSPVLLYGANSKALQNGSNYFFCAVKRKHPAGSNKFSLREKKEDENTEPSRKFSPNSNIFRNKYNCIPSLQEVKADIENFKREKSFYFTEHSILEAINVENNIVVVNIEGMFFEDINVVFAEVTKYLLNKHLGILGVHPYNIKSLNIEKEGT